MNLQYFPMDRQLCHIEIESCEYSNSQLDWYFQQIYIYSIYFWGLFQQTEQDIKIYFYITIEQIERQTRE